MKISTAINIDEIGSAIIHPVQCSHMYSHTWTKPKHTTSQRGHIATLHTCNGTQTTAKMHAFWYRIGAREWMTQ
jgi:hypothetical protein